MIHLFVHGNTLLKYLEKELDLVQLNKMKINRLYRKESLIHFKDIKRIYKTWYNWKNILLRYNKQKKALTKSVGAFP